MVIYKNNMEQVEEKQVVTSYMPSSKPPLHNFKLPGGLRWGNQKFLRCMNVDSSGQPSPVHRNNSNVFLPEKISKVGGGAGGAKDLKFDLITRSVHASTVAGETPSRLRRGAAVITAASKDRKERVKFSVSLGRREIEEDFMAMVRHRPPRRPKKRAKYIQKELDALFPGLWLTEITADKYKVPDTQ